MKVAGAGTGGWQQAKWLSERVSRGAKRHNWHSFFLEVPRVGSESRIRPCWAAHRLASGCEAADVGRVGAELRLHRLGRPAKRCAHVRKVVGEVPDVAWRCCFAESHTKISV